MKTWLPTGIAKVEVTNKEILVTLYEQFPQGKIRLIFAFHHSEIDDPLSLLYLFTRSLPKLDHKLGISLKYPFYTHFIYDQGMTIWSGKGYWLFS
ncbi:hypothetical protein RINTHM_7180 [Richelia intracellularis HM01]|nr:hypothetical protein RINTHM_7180 [Richelia intracellularis HM01]